MVTMATGAMTMIAPQAETRCSVKSGTPNHAASRTGVKSTSPSRTAAR